MLKSTVLALLRTAGIMSIYRIRRRDEVIILTFHGIMSPRPGQRWRPFRRFLAPERLEQYVRMLTRSKYTLVSLHDALEMVAGRRPILRNSAVLTFDDGYRNHATEAWPILRRYGVPATFFVATSMVQRPRPFSFDRMDYAFQNLPSNVERISVEIGGIRKELCVADRGERRDAFWEVRAECKKHDMHCVESVLAQLEGVSVGNLCDICEQDDWTALMTVADVKRIAQEGADIGSHTVDHVSLDRVTDATARDQLVESKHTIEQWTGRECGHVSYPRGLINTRTAGLAREAGYQGGVTTLHGGNRSGADLMLLRRVSAGAGLSANELLAVITGMSQALSRLKRFPCGASDE